MTLTKKKLIEKLVVALKIGKQEAKDLVELFFKEMSAML